MKIKKIIKNKYIIRKIAVLLIFALIVCTPGSIFAALSCSVTTTCDSPGVVIFKMSDTTNAHAEMPDQTNYSNLVCCTGVVGLGNECSGTYDTVFHLSAPTNAHVEANNKSNYTENNACISITSGTVVVGYTGTDCSGYDTTVASAEVTAGTNGHVGDADAYSKKVCASAEGTALTFNVSENSIGFGALSSSSARYATSDGLGSSSEVEAHTLSVSASSDNGYIITAQGPSLTSGGFNIHPNNAGNVGSMVGIEQFGIRLVATGGSGTVTSPYDGSGFAYNGTASTQSEIASASTGDGVETSYSVRYIANTDETTEAGDYSTSIIYAVTVQF